MNAGGWLMLIGSWALILVLNAFCFYKLFTGKPAGNASAEGDEGKG